MWNCRGVQVVYFVISTVLVFTCLVQCTSYAQEGDSLPLDDPNSAIRMLLSTIKTMETPATGRGTATMKIENVGGDIEGKDLIVDFVFKDQKSRTDFFKSDID